MQTWSELPTYMNFTQRSCIASLNKFNALCLVHAMDMDKETTVLLTWNDFLNWGDLPMNLSLNTLNSDTCDVQQATHPEIAMCQVAHVSRKTVGKYI